MHIRTANERFLRRSSLSLSLVELSFQQEVGGRMRATVNDLSSTSTTTTTTMALKDRPRAHTLTQLATDGCSRAPHRHESKRIILLTIANSSSAHAQSNAKRAMQSKRSTFGKTLLLFTGRSCRRSIESTGNIDSPVVCVCERAFMVHVKSALFTIHHAIDLVKGRKMSRRASAPVAFATIDR